MAQIGHVTGRRLVAGGGSRLALSCADGGRGALTCYELFDGIRLWALDMRTGARGELEGMRMGPGTCYLIHCGRGEHLVALGRRKVFDLAEGDLLCSTSESGRIAHSFPEASLQGLVLGIDRESVSAQSRRALGNFDVDLDAIPVVPTSDGAPELAASPEAAHILAELHEMLAHASRGAIRLKVIELLQLVVSGAGAAGRREARPTRRASHMQLAYRAQQLMMRDVARPMTIQALADACETSPTVLKEAFRETFGVPVYSWYRTYRMRQAAEMLLTSDLSVGEVATRVGYANPSKFTRAFADCMGKTPRAWRKERRGQRSVSIS